MNEHFKGTDAGTSTIKFIFINLCNYFLSVKCMSNSISKAFVIEVSKREDICCHVAYNLLVKEKITSKWKVLLMLWFNSINICLSICTFWIVVKRVVDMNSDKSQLLPRNPKFRQSAKSCLWKQKHFQWLCCKRLVCNIYWEPPKKRLHTWTIALNNPLKK